MSDAVVAGHLCLDVIPTFRTEDDNPVRLPAPGELEQVGPVILSTGGAVANTGLALRRLGLDVRLMGKVGDDAFGRIVVAQVRSHGAYLANGIAVARDEATSYTIVLNLPRQDRAFLHCTGTNDTFSAADLDLNAIERSRLFHFGYPPVMAKMYADGGVGLISLFQTVKRLDVTTSLDMAMIDPHSPAARADWTYILKATLPNVDVFLPSIEETLLLLRRQEYDRMIAQGAILDQVTPSLLRELAEMLIGWGAQIVGLKLGHRGMYLRTAHSERLERLGKGAPRPIEPWGDRELWAPVFRIERFGGTTGAGDATIAGFLAALLASCPPEQALTFACAVGACNVEEADALGGLRTWDETWTRIREGWERGPLVLNDPAWRFDPARQVWTSRGDMQGNETSSGSAT